LIAVDLTSLTILVDVLIFNDPSIEHLRFKLKYFPSKLTVGLLLSLGFTLMLANSTSVYWTAFPNSSYGYNCNFLDSPATHSFKDSSWFSKRYYEVIAGLIFN